MKGLARVSDASEGPGRPLGWAVNTDNMIIIRPNNNNLNLPWREGGDWAEGVGRGERAIAGGRG